MSSSGNKPAKKSSKSKTAKSQPTKKIAKRTSTKAASKSAGKSAKRAPTRSDRIVRDWLATQTPTPSPAAMRNWIAAQLTGVAPPASRADKTYTMEVRADTVIESLTVAADYHVTVKDCGGKLRIKKLTVHKNGTLTMPNPMPRGWKIDQSVCAGSMTLRF
jgi:hypothetical protein